MMYPLPQLHIADSSLDTTFLSSSSIPITLTTTKYLIKQGAEAHLYKTIFFSYDTPALLKHRPSKPYRHPVLDGRLTRARCLGEARLLVRVGAMERERCGDILGSITAGRRERGISGVKVIVPKVYFVDEARGEIYMEWIEGVTVREKLDKVLHPPKDSPRISMESLAPLMRKIGATLSRLHNVLDVVHGDLTTSNIMLRGSQAGQEGHGEDGEEEEVILIDFGLGSVSTQEEDKAVDLYVLERAFISTHPRAEGLFREVLTAYVEGEGRDLERSEIERVCEKGRRAKAEVVMKRLAEVRMRGRKRSMIG